MSDGYKPLTPTILPPDNTARPLVTRSADNAKHLGIAGDTYTMLLSGDDTDDKYCVIDMLVPPGGGPGPHRHDFEETFTLLDGEIILTFRGETSVARVGDTVNIPANAPHSFKNTSERPARMLCICSGPWQEQFFAAVGVPVDGRSTPPPEPTEAMMADFKKVAAELAPKYRTELLTEV